MCTITPIAIMDQVVSSIKNSNVNDVDVCSIVGLDAFLFLSSVGSIFFETIQSFLRCVTVING